jgi:hypothetical protein
LRRGASNGAIRLVRKITLHDRALIALACTHHKVVLRHLLVLVGQETDTWIIHRVRIGREWEGGAKTIAASKIGNARI